MAYHTRIASAKAQETFDSYKAHLEKHNVTLADRQGLEDVKTKKDRRAYFLGPKCENQEFLTRMVTNAIAHHAEARKAFHKADPGYTSAQMQSGEYTAAQKIVEKEAENLFNALQQSAPLWSMRHQGHMWWDQLVPAQIGYFAGMLYNQNNISAEAGPMTVILEQEVGYSISAMLGYDVDKAKLQVSPLTWGDKPHAWGHLTSGGNVANIESMWAARNARFHGLALADALRDKSTKIAQFAPQVQVELANGKKVTLSELDPLKDAWTLINIPLKSALDATTKLQELTKGDESLRTAIDDALEDRTIISLGLLGLYEKYELSRQGIKSPKIFSPATNHYSWPKGATLLGLGKKALDNTTVDLRGRQNLEYLLSGLKKAAADRQPVIMSVAVIGTTQENAVDDLHQILEFRKQFRAEQGLDFYVHADGAWGGYFASMLAKPCKFGIDINLDDATVPSGTAITDDPSLHRFANDLTWRMSPYVKRQYESLVHADSITVDPHKAGYVPYPGGALCYRDTRTKDFNKIQAAVVYREGENAISIWGIEGSKPGAASTATYLAHKCVGPHKFGYGKMLARCVFASKRIFCLLNDIHDDRIIVVPYQQVPCREGQTAEANLKLVQEFSRMRSDDLIARLSKNDGERAFFSECGSDLVIIGYTMNFIDKTTKALNADEEKLNIFNERLFQKFSVTTPRDPEKTDQPMLIVTTASFYRNSHGPVLLDSFGSRLGVEKPTSINYLISTTMDPWTAEDPAKGEASFLDVFKRDLMKGANEVLQDCEARNWSFL